jgi:hypothetical protein
MIIDEAIQILSEYDVNFGYHTSFEIADAFDMAIKALKQYGALQEIRQEINKAIDCIPITFSRDKADDCLKRDIKDIFDKHITEIEG